MKSIPSSNELLRQVMKPHLEVARDLLSKVKRRSTDDPTHRFQVVAVSILLSGIDKTLGLALQLLYLAGKIDWKWLKPKQPLPGTISCGPGLTAKIFKFKELGLDITELREFVELRNEYVHSCSIYAGYSIGITRAGKPRLTLRARGPVITYGDTPLIDIDGANARRVAEKLISLVSRFIDRNG